ncbi:MAG: gamma carbonic anhydrase family protein [Acidobacteria bacterium]|nr:gamma carbonic anhydrase family protein [Acidobacteriota bacterium]
MIRPFKGVHAKIAETAFVHEMATVIGDVHIGEHSSIWPGAVLRGDLYYIRVGRYTNIQDGSILHVITGKYPTIVGDYVTVGHNVILHGCTVKDRCLIGMGAIVLDDAVVGEQALVAAGSLVAMGQVVPPRTLVAGIPAKVKRELSEEEIQRMEEGCNHYLELKEIYLKESFGQTKK